jgi:hypothetical protein
LRAGFSWDLRQPPGVSVLAEAMSRRASWPRPWQAGLVAGYRARVFSAEDAFGPSRVAMHEVPILLVGRGRWRALPRLGLALGAAAGVTWARARISSYGLDARGGSVCATFEAGAEVEAMVARNRVLVVGARGRLAQTGRLSSGDSIDGSGAALIVDLGYRFFF